MKFFSTLAVFALISNASAKVTFKAHQLDQKKIEWNKDLKGATFDKKVTLDIDTVATSVSGYSSGGFLSSGLFDVYPNLIDNAGIVSGAPPGTAGQVKHTKKDYEGKKSYHYHGGKDFDVPVLYGKYGAQYFKTQGAKVKTDIIHDFNHVVPNALPEGEWNTQRSCNIVTNVGDMKYWKNAKLSGGLHFNCGFNLARNMLTHFSKNGKLNEWDLKPQTKGNLYAISQDKWNTKGVNLDKNGYMYVPHVCAKKQAKCSVHFHFHGCGSGAGWFNDVLVRKTGLIEFAATNNMVIVFPQSKDTVVFKYKGKDFPVQYCWGAGHQAKKDHPQFKAIAQMIKDFTQ